MTKPKQKLELTWVGKGEEPKLEPLSYLNDTLYRELPSRLSFTANHRRDICH
jgi:hypothetical protein